MKLLELSVENLPGVPDGACSFAATSGGPLDVVALTGDAAGDLLQTIAALLEAVRAPAPTAHHLAWWARRHGAGEARVRACWALSEGEVAFAGLPGGTAVSEWRFGPDDQVPREVQVEGALFGRARARLAGLARYLHVDANETSVWMGADPLAELLAGIARRDVAATRVACRQGVGIVGWQTSDTIAALTLAIARVCPSLRLARVACAPGESPVACFRREARVELDQLADAERWAIHLAAAIHAGNVRGGLVLANWPELPMPTETSDRWFDWITDLAATHQLQLVMASVQTNRR